MVHISELSTNLKQTKTENMKKLTTKTSVCLAVCAIAILTTSCQTTSPAKTEIAAMKHQRNDPAAAISEEEAEHFDRQRNQQREERDLGNEKLRDRNYNVRDSVYTFKTVARTFDNIVR